MAGTTLSLTGTAGITLLSGTGSLLLTEPATPTGPYSTYTSKITLSSETVLLSTDTSANASAATTALTFLTGSATASTIVVSNVTATGTDTSSSNPSAPPEPTNTTPCNGWVEFCSRPYSNITVVGAHNSPFVRPGNSAANQQLDVTTQLNDGIRFLQAQMHWPTNATAGDPPHFCHTSCDLLDAGPVGDWLALVESWVAAHPYDVVTVLLENGNYSSPALYAPWIEQSGLVRWAYTPPFLPMARGDWPTLEAMILAGKRVVMFLDYGADQHAYPWLLDEFAQVWETPFDPTDMSFPCTVQRPPGLDTAGAQDRLYIMNHNLNAEFDVFGASILVPAVALLNQTNNVSGPGSVGDAARACLADWGVPPTVLDVDYYNFGGFPGSVFEVAAELNNVTYDKTCCGMVPSVAAGNVPLARVVVLLWALMSALLLC